VNVVRKHANGRAQNDDIAVVTFGRLEAGAGPNTSITNKLGTSTSLKLQG
jgi:hypothetical protein